MSAANRVILCLVLVLNLCIHFLDQATDFFSAFLFFTENEILTSILTLGFIFAPGFYIFINEMKRMCSAKSNICKALGYLLLSPLWAIIVHGYSLFDDRYVVTAFYFKTLEGFLEAGPQLLLQLSLLFRGSWSQSSKLVLDPLIAERIDNSSTISVYPKEQNELDVFGRIYTEDERQWFGYIHILSVILSFVSVFLASISFNDIEPNRRVEESNLEWPSLCSKKTMVKIMISIPFILCTLVFRSLALSLIICFAKFWGGVIIFGLFFVNVLSALSIGDNFSRSLSYGLWSILVPVGFNRDPSSPLGYTKLPLFLSSNKEDEKDEQSDSPVTENELRLSSSRAKHFLTVHLVSSIGILAPCVLLTFVLVQTYPEYYQLNSHAIFNLNYLNTIFLPLLGLCLGFSVLLARPYHRCDCSDSESPKGNIIV